MRIGRPFLVTGGVCIDVKRGTLSFNIGKELEEFHVVKRVKSRVLNKEDLNVHSLEPCCMISTSPPLNLSGKSRVAVETSVEEVEHHKASTID